MSHPAPEALLELHFDEALPGERASLEEHLHGCPECRGFVSDLRQLEREVGPGPDDAPPRDGLDRVRARVAEVHPARRRGAEWALAAGPCTAAMLAGAWAIRVAGERLAALGAVSGASVGPLSGEVLGLSLAALGLVVLGALITLALAPVLILESHGRS